MKRIRLGSICLLLIISFVFILVSCTQVFVSPTSETSGISPDESGETPDEPGETLDEPGETLDEPGETLDEPGETPDEPGETPDEPGETPDESGETPDESGETPDNIMTELDPQYLVLVNKEHPLGADYIPNALVRLICPTNPYNQREETLNFQAAMALYSMLIAMGEDGVTDIFVTSSYRSYDRQQSLFYGYIDEEMSKNPALTREQAEQIVLTYSAYPGTSEHQTGLCVDFGTNAEYNEVGEVLTEYFEETDAYEWLIENSYRFGFILRYPEDKVSITGHSYEPWHFRFVGEEAATAIMKNGLCLEEFLIPDDVDFISVNETVMVIEENSTFWQISKPNQTVKFEEGTPMIRTGYNNFWSKVRCAGVEYYVATSALSKFASVYEMVYVIAENTNFLLCSDTNQVTNFKIGTEMIRTDYSSFYSKVIYEGVEYFVVTSALSTDDLTGKTFTICNKTKYVNVNSVNVRKLASEEDSISEILGTIALDTEVKVTAESEKWSKVEVLIDGKTVTGFILSEYLSLTPQQATLDDMIKAYPGLVKYEKALNLYTTGSVCGRSSPSFVKDSGGKDFNIVKLLNKCDVVKAVAYGMLETIDEDGSKFDMTWVLVEDEDLGFYFVSYRYLTPNSDGTPAQIPASLDELLELYGFTETTLTIKTSVDIKAMSAPDSSSIAKEIEEGTTLKVVAQGQIEDDFLEPVKWFIVEYDDGLYFIVNESANYDIV